MSTLLAVIIFGALIFVHEFGHFVLAKYHGVRVDEFSLGMGPKLLGMQKGETVYSLRILPLGGYVKLAGMENPKLDDPRGFNKKNVLQRMSIIFAGPLMNFITAMLLFIAVYGFIGIPGNSNTVGTVLAGFPAEQAGISAGDQIVEINGMPVATWQEVTSVIHQYPEEEIALTVLRDETSLEVRLVPQKDPDLGVGLIGILSSTERQSLLSSISLGVKTTYAFTKELVINFLQMITREIAADVVGPVGVVQIVGEVSAFGWGSVLQLAGILSINLGVINLFPIPVLDGSRLIFLGIEGLRGRPIDPAKENMIHLVGFALLMLLMVVITYKDIMRIFS